MGKYKRSFFFFGVVQEELNYISMKFKWKYDFGILKNNAILLLLIASVLAKHIVFIEAISCFYELFWRIYWNKMKTIYGHIKNYFRKLSQTPTQIDIL